MVEPARCLQVNCGAVRGGWSKARCAYTTRSRTRESMIVQEHTPWSSKKISSSMECWYIREQVAPDDGHKFENWRAGVCWLVKEAMSSLSSSGTVVSVPVSASPSSSPPSSGGARTQWLVALSLRLTRSHSALADVLGRTDLYRRRAI